jgi:hypothetical protein
LNITHNRLTDVYLLGLAASHDGKLGSLDQRMPAKVVRGEQEELTLIVS